ncbi:MAG: excinuclease ABC subunit UvrA [Pseudomonadota bacterium]|nr:excinuclease ABC subunit UvrA [Pseudomonadota bacterium]
MPPPERAHRTVDIRIRGASEHNLRSVDLDLPRERLVVFTGPSGSGKSSLAFDTLHAESQRRFVEALSSYVRQQFGATKKPAYELLTGLTPSIGVAQRGLVAPSPRATVGTLTEVHELLRVLWARTGAPHCPRCDRPVSRTPADAIVRALLGLPVGARLVVCAPFARARTGSLKPLLDGLVSQGFARVRIDRTTVALDEVPPLDGRVPHDVDVVVDRIKVSPDRKDRMQEAVDAALRIGRGALVAEVDGEDTAFTAVLRCLACDLDLPEPAPRLFSFNSPVGACPDCQGLGVTRSVDPDRLVPDPTKSLADGAVEGWKGALKRSLEASVRARGVPTDVPWQALPWEQRHLVLYGDPPESTAAPRLEGAVALAEKKGTVAVEERTCPACKGARLGPAARAVRVSGRSLAEVSALALTDTRAFVADLPPGPIVAPLQEELGRRLDFLLRTGLGYLTLDRSAATLSGGELQRLRLAAQAGNQLSGVLYVLDEPTAGLHPEDTRALVAVLTDLRDAGNTVLVVEHDLDVVRAADLVVDFGPGAGRAGGEIVFVGTPEALLAADTSTGRWLSGRETLSPPSSRRLDRWLTLRGATGHNLRAPEVRFPLGALVGVTGVSGSGKSSLVEDTLGRALTRKLGFGGPEPLPHTGLEGADAITRIVRVDQAPLGRSARSNPATATKIWDPIRQLYAKTAEAKLRGFGPERFLFNQPGGRCEACEGEGVRRVAMHFLPDVTVPCEVCDGRRFDEATLAVTWKGASIADVLAMPVRDARNLFPSVPQIAGPLATLDALGLGYLALGQPGDTLSGGEAQRVKLARELGRKGEVPGTLYLLDEPSVGLHPSDVALLVEALRQLVEQGGSVLAVEHDPVLLGGCDWLVELGPGAGSAGGGVIAEGAPATIRATPGSRTGRYL